jgi:hypothetical protein
MARSLRPLGPGLTRRLAERTCVNMGWIEQCEGAYEAAGPSAKRALKALQVTAAGGESLALLCSGGIQPLRGADPRVLPFRRLPFQITMISLLLPLVLGRGALLSWTAHLRTSAILAEATTHMLSATAGQL